MDKKFLTIAEASNYTGFSKSHLHYLTSTRKIKFSKPFGKVIFLKISDVDEFLAQNQNEPQNGKPV